MMSSECLRITTWGGAKLVIYYNALHPLCLPTLWFVCKKVISSVTFSRYITVWLQGNFPKPDYQTTPPPTLPSPTFVQNCYRTKTNFWEYIFFIEIIFVPNLFLKSYIFNIFFDRRKNYDTFFKLQKFLRQKLTEF